MTLLPRKNDFFLHILTFRFTWIHLRDAICAASQTGVTDDPIFFSVDVCIRIDAIKFTRLWTCRLAHIKS